ncbi:hypothetical protein C8J56DRAFT_803532 [Mycena floridula]|nr:hypothetical protein C8J56DRAFT_803532 [Mycena floridula]
MARSTNKGLDHIPRPQNAWIVFRSHWCRTNDDRVKGMSQQQISKMASSEWKALLSVFDNNGDDGQKPWRDMAAAQKAAHERKYPGYVFAPKPRTNAGDKWTRKEAGIKEAAKKKEVAEKNRVVTKTSRGSLSTAPNSIFFAPSTGQLFHRSEASYISPPAMGFDLDYHRQVCRRVVTPIIVVDFCPEWFPDVHLEQSIFAPPESHST